MKKFNAAEVAANTEVQAQNEAAPPASEAAASTTARKVRSRRRASRGTTIGGIST